MNKRVVGGKKEASAAAYLRSQGVRIIEQNFRIRQGEIDLIGYEGNTLVFFEVKYRKNEECGNPLEAVDYRKQRQICKVAMHYRSMHRTPPDVSVRYDVVAITGDAVSWMKNAFPDCSGGF